MADYVEYSPDKSAPIAKSESQIENISTTYVPSGGGGGDRAEDESWGTLLWNFTQETTFHGIRYITGETRYQIRR